MSDWLNELKNEISNISGGNKSTSEVPVNNTGKNNNLVLFVVIVALAAGVFFAWKSKQNQNMAWQSQQQSPSSLFQQQPFGSGTSGSYTGGAGGYGNIGGGYSNPHMGVMTTEQKLDVLKKQYENVDLAAQKIWEVTKWNRDRMMLLATVNNHNLVVLQENHPRNELIYLNSDWTINRMPNRINLDQGDQEFIRKFMR